jgi:hypothetical protein
MHAAPTIAPDSIRHAAGGVLGRADASLNRQPVKSRPLNSGTKSVAIATATDAGSAAGDNDTNGEPLRANVNDAAANRRLANPKRMEGFFRARRRAL